jgi:hypothetical protein
LIESLLNLSIKWLSLICETEYLGREEDRVMEVKKWKWINIFLVLAIVALFIFGCAGVSKDTKVKCPKCGTVFSVSEGLKGGGGGP